MGGDHDLMDPVSHHGAEGITPCEARNREVLCSIMEASGFDRYECEWWHYTLRPGAVSGHLFRFPHRLIELAKAWDTERRARDMLSVVGARFDVGRGAPALAGRVAGRRGSSRPHRRPRDRGGRIRDRPVWRGARDRCRRGCRRVPHDGAEVTASQLEGTLGCNKEKRRRGTNRSANRAAAPLR